MPAFPEFTHAPVVDEFSQGLLSDPVHRAEFESGALLTRTRTTAVPIRRAVLLDGLTDDEKLELEDFERNVIGYGGEAFTWRDQSVGDPRTWNARLLAPIAYTRHPPSNAHWQARVVLALTSEVTL